MADIKWLEITVNTTPDQLDQVSAKLTAAGMDGLVIEDEGDFLQFLEQNRQYWDYVDQELLDRLLGEEALLRRNYLTYLTGRIRFLNARLGSLAVGDTEGRVVRYLLSSLSYGAVECSASGLARQLGISRASVYRAFQDLEQAGLIRREGRAILVPDPAALEGVRGSG